MGRALTQDELFDQGRRRCHACKKIKSLDDFYKDAKGKGGKGYRCKDCAKRIAARDFRENKPARKATGKRYRSQPHIRAQARDRLLQMKYGVDSKEYDRILARQRGVCAICKQDRRDARGREMPVDHDHDTGKVRGILCDHCNRIIGLFQENPTHLRNAARYLRAWAKRW